MYFLVGILLLLVLFLSLFHHHRKKKYAKESVPCPVMRNWNKLPA